MVDIKEVAKKVIADEALAIQNLARFRRRFRKSGPIDL